MPMHKNLNMCDLIDLNSPDRKDFISSRLASPLIPVPTDTTNGNCNNRINNACSLVTGKRDSLENNPFDMVLHKTTEYIQKKDDPFEVVLEKALKPKYKKNPSSKTCSVDFTDDYDLKRKKRSPKLKMNKTLDEASINKELSQTDVLAHKISNKGIEFKLKKFDIQTDDLKKSTDTPLNLSSLKNEDIVPTIQIEDTNLSILNQSIMNDTLFKEENDICSDNSNKISTNLKEDINNIDFIPPSIALLKLPNLRRSFSQGENVLPKRPQHLNWTSMTENIQTEQENKSGMLSPLDVLNEAFLKSRSTGSSVFSSLTSISSIATLNTTSPVINASLMLSNGTLNRTFLESCSSEKSDDANKINSTVSSSKGLIKPVANHLNKTRSSISDLTDRLNKLKAKTSELHVPENTMNQDNETTSTFSNDIKECVTVIEKKEECDTNNRLIDVDLFSPESNYSMDQCKSSISDTSSDSVFLDGNKINQSILHEAKLLARTFEEMALKTSSGSSIDDLITNNPLWASELLPAFDDEVDNLIELPTSPNINNVNSDHGKVIHYKDSVLHGSANEKPIVNKSTENMKDLEKELIDPMPTENRVSAATLLLDLKKLIKTENNTEANQLLENLEKALCINCESNTELLTTYLNLTNNLAKSPHKSNSNLEIKNVAETNMECSQENNVTCDLLENVKESAFGKNLNSNNSDIDKSSANSQKCLKEISSELKESNEELTISNENKEKDSDVQNVNTESTCTMESNSSLNENDVMELLTNIGKLLTGQPREHSTVNFLKNFEKVLHLVSSNGNVNENKKTVNNDVEIEKISKPSKLKYENKTHSSVLSKSANRLSLDLESKKQPVNKPETRKSISVFQTPPIKTIPSPLLSKRKGASQLKQVTKRFPSDPGFIGPVSNQKTITNDNKHNSLRDKETKSVTTTNFDKEKSTVIGAVKNKLKKKVGGDVINKKGPMKAILPIGNMQKRASSTPDAQNSKTRKIPSQTSNNVNKRNFGCDISPVTTRVNANNSNGANYSPKRFGKIPSPKRTTPKRCSVDSSIPRSQTPPIHKKLNSSFDVNRYERLTESPQGSLCKVSSSQKNSPISLKRNGNNTQQSPLRDNNKVLHKVKPKNLISKLRRHSVGNNITEKENAYI
ncbi:uncharacterized protein LOC143353352 isoform X2 [Halictus rubicundus]|uniref:uncharacterized protein LOC143353352 isoform X2 n=1 Tax=Halictus rubicundus TaxID=77578 RepID=UPI004035773D